MRIFTLMTMLALAAPALATDTQDAVLLPAAVGVTAHAPQDLRRVEATGSLAAGMRARRAVRRSTAVLASAVVPADPRGEERRESVRRSHVDAPATALIATHVGSDAEPVRAPYAPERNAIAKTAAKTTPGTCSACGEPAAQSYAVYCQPCRDSRFARR